MIGPRGSMENWLRVRGADQHLRFSFSVHMLAVTGILGDVKLLTGAEIHFNLGLRLVVHEPNWLLGSFRAKFLFPLFFLVSQRDRMRPRPCSLTRLALAHLK